MTDRLDEMSAIRAAASSNVMKSGVHILMIMMPILQTCGSATTVIAWPGAGTDPKHRMSKSDPQYFDSIVEHAERGEIAPDHSYEEIKALLAKVLQQIEEIKRRSESSQLDKDKVHARATPATLTTCKSNPKKKEDVKTARPHDEAKEAKDKDKKGGAVAPAGAKWGHWTEWSSCSVSCGKGRQIRWRHCVDRCDEAETEMEEKTCQLPACSPGKLFGVIKI